MSPRGTAVGPLRIGLVGCGRLAEVGYLPALASVPDLRLVAMADPDPSRRDHLAGLGATAAGGAPIGTHPGIDALLDRTEVDALVVATPTASHVADARAAAAAGVVALVEKPPAPDAPTASALRSLAPAPWLAFNRRFDPAARRLRDQLPPAGRLDLDLAITYRRSGWNAHQVRDDALLDLGPHLVDWARWLTGAEPREVRCPSLAPERVTIELVTDRGRVAIHASTDRPHDERIEARDEAGRLVARHRAGGLVAAVKGRVSRGPHPLTVSLAAQLAALASILRGGPAGDLGTPADGYAAMTVIDAARESAASGGRAVAVAPAADH